MTTGEWGTDPTAGDALAQEAHALWQTWRKGDDPALLLEPAPQAFSRGDPNLANCSWSLQRLRIVDFEYSGWSDRATDLADLVEHVQSRGTPGRELRVVPRTIQYVRQRVEQISGSTPAVRSVLADEDVDAKGT